MTRTISLTRGQVALVDDSDYEWLSKYKWHAFKDLNTFYAISWDGKRHIRMHRVILCAPEGIDVDHRDGDGLNNTRANLRLASMSQNIANSPKRKDNASGFKGVYWEARRLVWRAQLQVNKRRLHLGYFDTPEAAARAYDVAAREHFAEFARTNSTEAQS